MRHRPFIAIADTLAALAVYPGSPSTPAMPGWITHILNNGGRRRRSAARGDIFSVPAKVGVDKDEPSWACIRIRAFRYRMLPDCRTVTSGRLRVVDPLPMRNGSALLQISGDARGYVPYEIFRSQPYKTGKRVFPDGT